MIFLLLIFFFFLQEWEWNYFYNYFFSMLTQLFLYTMISGITIFLGGLVANYFNHHMEKTPVKAKITHFMMSFGWGVILSAVALVLVPKSMQWLDILPLSLLFLAGAISFFFLDRWLHKKAWKVGMLLAMMMDFIPESIILWSLFLVDPWAALFLAIFMGLQNFSEAFTAFRNLVLSGFSVGKTLLFFFVLSFFGFFSALFGYFFLRDKPLIIAGLMSFSSGGILYLLFQDISPESRLKWVYITWIGAVFGFLLGMIGEKML